MHLRETDTALRSMMSVLYALPSTFAFRANQPAGMLLEAGAFPWLANYIALLATITCARIAS